MSQKSTPNICPGDETLMGFLMYFVLTCPCKVWLSKVFKNSTTSFLDMSGLLHFDLICLYNLAIPE